MTRPVLSILISNPHGRRVRPPLFFFSYGAGIRLLWWFYYFFAFRTLRGKSVELTLLEKMNLCMAEISTIAFQYYFLQYDQLSITFFAGYLFNIFFIFSPLNDSHFPSLWFPLQ